jgi:hypothetical protein
MAEFQRLRCRVAFHALQFRTDIQILGRRMVERYESRHLPYCNDFYTMDQILMYRRLQLVPGLRLSLFNDISIFFLIKKKKTAIFVVVLH